MKLYKNIIVSVNTLRTYCGTARPIMKFLNVAEKNDAAKNIAGFLSRGTARRREGLSRYNKIYEFDAPVLNQNTKMVMTSVSGHLLNYEFTVNFRHWKSCNPVALFDAPVVKSCSQNYESIKKTLEREIRTCNGLIIWTDCDREGENIGFEIIKVCKDVQPNIQVYRAKFSEITAASVFRAINNLEQPNKNVSDAVDVRQEIDLRTGAAFTRLQTLHLSQVFPEKLSEKLISYGSCQFPTLGFVVDRFKDIESFVPEQFWRLKMAHTKGDLTVEYVWDRNRLFAKRPCESLLEICNENPTATVESIISKPKSKWRPLPLDTVEMEKTVSKKLRINAKETMRIAEHLYTQGFISYPRTETNIFPKELNLTTLVEQQTVDQRWGDFATGILNDGGPTPRQGKKSDQAHPPIHPTKHALNLSGNDNRLYEYIVRHFLACVSKDALGHETIVKVNIADEKFTAKGLIVLERHYLSVYIYENWNGKEIHYYQQGERFMPSVLGMAQGSTTAPRLLTEADLITLMDKNGIGTDATHADHIDTIKTREYVGLHEKIYFIPGTLGMGLVEGYDSIGLEVSLAKPILRSNFEKDLKLICDGLKNPQIVLDEQVAKYRAMFENVADRMQQLEEKLAARIEERRTNVENINTIPVETFKEVLKCPKCKCAMVIKKRKNDVGYFMSCCGYPNCKNAVWFPGFVEQMDVLDESCPSCGPNVKKLKIKFKNGQNPFFDENPQILCIGGCDMVVMETLNIAITSVINTNDPQERNRTVTNSNVTENRPAINRNATVVDNSTRHRPNATVPRSDNARLNNLSVGRSNNTGLSTVPVPRAVTNANNPRITPNQGLPNVPAQRRKPALNVTTASKNTANAMNSTITSTDVPVCTCGIEAALLTVRKEGPNTGRQFYKCQKGKDYGGCDYFLWASDLQSTSAQPSTQRLPGPSVSVDVYCNCGQEAALRTVQKGGPNKGRKFYCCPGSMDNRCNFFQWADEDSGNNVSGGSGGGGGGGGGGWGGRGGGGSGKGSYKKSWGNKKSSRGKYKGGTKRKAPTNSSSGTKARRRCGLCGEEGHIRTHCPNASR